MAKAILRTGTAGWVYAPWRGSFYPDGLSQKQELAYAGRHLTAIEINATFRSFQNPESFRKWAGEVGDDFVFAVKGHQLITHFKRLDDVEVALADFFASGLFNLGGKLGPICWQLPENLKFEPDRVERFLALLPRDAAAAEALAARHSDRMKHPPVLEAAGITTLRHALEVRHGSYRTPEFIDLLRSYGVALVTADTADWPATDLTADFAYARLQGPAGGDHYDESGLDRWATMVSAWLTGAPAPAGDLIAAPTDPLPRDAYVFFVHNDKEHAPMNAMALADRVKALADQ